MKKLFFGVICLLILFCLIGCNENSDNELKSDEEVIEIVRNICTGEEFEIISKDEHITNDKKDTYIIYHFQTTGERNIEFVAYSYFSHQDSIAGGYYISKVNVSYKQEIEKLYYDKYVEEIKKYNDSHNNIVIKYEELDKWIIPEISQEGYGSPDANIYIYHRIVQLMI